MKFKFFSIVVSVLLFGSAPVVWAQKIDSPPTETLIFVRHGEKPNGGFGQLSCQGLNRALALPSVLVNSYGVPDYIFAPNTTITRVRDHHRVYDYVRPLATIEPTAISLRMPVNTTFGFAQVDELRNELLGAGYRNSVIFIAWEHIKLVDVVKSIMAARNASPDVVPDWDDGDYDSIYVVTITTDNSGRQVAAFRQDYEQLDGQSKNCPGN